MIIIVNDNWVDLDKPVRMTDRQIKDFKTFIEEEFGSCEVKNIIEKSPDRGGSKTSRKNWKNPELVELFSGKDISVLERELGRNSMSIEMKTQEIVFNVVAWAKKRGRAIPPTEKDIKDFLGEKFTYKIIGFSIFLKKWRKARR